MTATLDKGKNTAASPVTTTVAQGMGKAAAAPDKGVVAPPPPPPVTGGGDGDGTSDAIAAVGDIANGSGTGAGGGAGAGVPPALAGIAGTAAIPRASTTPSNFPPATHAGPGRPGPGRPIYRPGKLSTSCSQQQASCAVSHP